MVLCYVLRKSNSQLFLSSVGGYTHELAREVSDDVSNVFNFSMSFLLLNPRKLNVGWHGFHRCVRMDEILYSVAAPWSNILMDDQVVEIEGDHESLLHKVQT